jgi:hypothetical protein
MGRCYYVEVEVKGQKPKTKSRTNRVEILGKKSVGRSQKTVKDEKRLGSCGIWAGEEQILIIL